MTIIKIIKMAWRSMLVNKVRTGLTVLGVVIGMASIIIVFSAGEGISGLILGQIESFGTDIIETEIKVPTGKKGMSGEQQSGTAIVQGVQVTTLNLDDLEDIKKLDNIKDGYAGIMSQEQASFGNETDNVYLFGTNASYISIDKSEIAEGRFFSEEEDKSLAQVIVLGYKIKEKLFGESEVIGKSVRIRKSKYKVIGVIEERGSAGTLDFDNYVYMPIRTLQKKLMGIDHVLYMVHQVYDLALAEDTAEEMRFILRENHDIDDPDRDDFRVVTMEEMMDTLGTITNALTLLLLAIVIISLVVGGVGIMNIMYVTVSERTPEIGLRKAIGAKYFDIMFQFLIESVLITLMGGILGVLVGLLVSFLISVGASYYGFDWEFAVPLRAYGVAFVFSVFFGVIFGIYPSRKAARMNPIEALRRE